VTPAQRRWDRSRCVGCDPLRSAARAAARTSRRKAEASAGRDPGVELPSPFPGGTTGDTTRRRRARARTVDWDPPLRPSVRASRPSRPKARPSACSHPGVELPPRVPRGNDRPWGRASRLGSPGLGESTIRDTSAAPARALAMRRMRAGSIGEEGSGVGSPGCASTPALGPDLSNRRRKNEAEGNPGNRLERIPNGRGLTSLRTTPGPCDS
jgi:hypothetical protein